MIPGYDIIEELAADELHGLYRGRRQGEAGTVLIKAPLTLLPRASEIAALKREFEILKSLPITGIARADAWIESDRGCVLALEDPGGVLLQSLAGAERPKLAFVLDIAIQVAATLAELHRRDIVYRNVTPRAILIDTSGRTQLIDFSNAARGPAEASIPLPRHYYRTRLPYAAPEQTGRMNRIVDYRADFYSFGVVLYELLTGARPFNSDDPLELTHA
ncbi:MAG TPA: protein kinase, partial [Burkholderiales bacterium]|nr:protein kinase [Burkholderiales bacterium]